MIYPFLAISYKWPRKRMFMCVCGGLFLLRILSLCRKRKGLTFISQMSPPVLHRLIVSVMVSNRIRT